MSQRPKKPKTSFVCNACGAQLPKWSGQCPDCGAWNAVQEIALPVAAPTQGRAGYAGGGYAGGSGGAAVQLLADVLPEQESRRPSGIVELDRVLGGGLVQGSVVLIGGDPGIGKSTLLLQACAALGAHEPVLYVTGEESPQQVSLRAHRLGLPVAEGAAQIRLLAETCVEQVLATAAAERPRVLVIDSIQTLFTDSLNSAPGSVSQVRESAAQLVRFAKLSWHHRVPGRACDQRGCAGRAAGARAHGRHRAVFRGRSR